MGKYIIKYDVLKYVPSWREYNTEEEAYEVFDKLKKQQKKGFIRNLRIL